MSTSAAPRSAPRSAHPYTTPSPVSSPVSDLEPDEAWIANKRIQIEAGFQSMIQDAKDRLERTLQALPFDRGDPEWDAKTKGFFKACQDEKDAIRQLAKEELENEIATERLMRGMTIAGLSVDATVKNSVMQEQEAILAMIERERRNSTAGSVSQANVSSGSSNTAAAPQQIPQQAPHSQSSHSHSSQQREAPRPTTVPAATSTSSSTNAPVWEPPSARSSPEMFKPPARPNQPEPPPTELRTSPGPPGSHSAPQASANEGHFGSLGRTTASAAAQERRTPGSGAAPASNGAPTDNRRMSTAPTGPPPSEGSFGSVGRTAAKERRMSGAGAPSGAPTDNRRMSTAPSAPNSAHRTPTAPLVSPVSARHEPSRQPTAPPVAERTNPGPGPPPFNPYSSPARPSASLHRQTSQTWKEATSTPISTESYRPVPSSLRTRPSQSSFRSTSSSNSGVRAEATWAPELTDEPEEEESFERAVPIPSSARSRDPASIPENPIATSPPAAREFWTPTITPEEDAQASRFGRDRSGSGLRSSPSLKRKPMPSSFVEASASSTAPLDVRKHAEREAAERQETERSWKNLEQSREKEKSVGRAGGARLSTASEQVHRQNEHVSGGSTSYPDGPSTFIRPADNSGNARPFPSSNAAPSSRTVDPPETFPTSGSYRSPSHLSQGSIPNGIPTGYFPNVPPSSLEDSAEEEDENSSGSSSYSSEPMSNPAPTSISAIPIGGGSRSTPYSYTPSKSAAVPIPTRQRIPEDDPDPLLAQSPGEYSRWGTPQRGASSFSESLRGASSLSSRVNAFEAEREQERLRVERERERAEREREREEREREQRVQEAERKAKEVAEDAQRKAEEVQRKAEELQRQQEETEKKLREISEREANLRQREAEMRRKEEENKQKEAARQAARQREEAARQKEEAARQREEAERQRKEKEKRQAEEVARQREEAERQRIERERRQAEEVARQREEAERQRKENEKRQAEEVARQREEAERQRKEKERRQAEAEKHRKEAERQFQFEQQAAEIKRKAEERKRQGSMDSENTWSSYSSWGTPSRAAPASPSPSNTTSSSTRSNTTGSSSAGTWSSTSSQASSGGARTSSTATPNGKPTWTGPSSTPRAGTQPNPGSANSEDWARRQREQAEEQFRKMQEQLERERQAKEQKAGRMLSKEDVVRIYQLHEQQWAKMSSHAEVTWDMLPWPMYKKPNSAEEITSGAVDAYIMSPNYPEPEKSTKDRVRQHLRRWHEDHFNQKVLVKVGEADKERVKAAAGTVTRNLNNLLERTNESKKAGSGVFG